MSPERRAKGGLGCPVSHPEHGDTLKRRRVRAYLSSQVRSPDHGGSSKAQGYPLAAALQRAVAGTGRMCSERGQRMTVSW
ncbi:MAG: hypothetical protein [Olavius algarvensis Gamma 1 endosymbiont]|nr:MAG: hypothetical protein [Olavius algarvensis Gamma 1 endosymbiont]